MMCRPYGAAGTRDGSSAEAARPPRSPQDRVGDRDRQASADRLSRAYAEGLLSIQEFDDHLALAYAAVTVDDLETAEAPLPASWLASLEQQRRQEEHQARRSAAWRGELRTYAGVMLLLFGIWAVTALTAGAWYPWPLWPALGWGIPLLLGRGARSTGDVAVPSQPSSPRPLSAPGTRR